MAMGKQRGGMMMKYRNGKATPAKLAAAIELLSQEPKKKNQCAYLPKPISDLVEFAWSTEQTVLPIGGGILVAQSDFPACRLLFYLMYRDIIN